MSHRRCSSCSLQGCPTCPYNQVLRWCWGPFITPSPLLARHSMKSLEKVLLEVTIQSHLTKKYIQTIVSIRVGDLDLETKSTFGIFGVLYAFRNTVSTTIGYIVTIIFTTSIKFLFSVLVHQTVSLGDKDSSQWWGHNDWNYEEEYY